MSWAAGPGAMAPGGTVHAGGGGAAAQRCLVQPHIVSNRARCLARRGLWSKAGTWGGRAEGGHFVWGITRFALTKAAGNRAP